MFFSVLWFFTAAAGFASTIISTPSVPKVVTGAIYQNGSEKILFTFQRTATNAGPLRHVQCRYNLPGGQVAAVEDILYRTNHLVSYHLDDSQANVWGGILVRPDAKNPGQEKISINYCRTASAKENAGSLLKPNTLIGDQIYPFILDHWNALMQGDIVRFNFISLEWQTTFAFQLVKASEIILHGVPMVRIQMKPSGFFVSKLVKPMYFVIEENGAHRLAEYIGRCTPRIKKGNSWKPLDARLVIDWK